METIQLICRANQLPGLNMMATLVLNELRHPYLSSSVISMLCFNIEQEIPQSNTNANCLRLTIQTPARH